MGEVGLSGKRSSGLADVYEAIKADLTALRSFPREQDAIWKALFHPTTLCLVFVVAICRLFAILQLIADLVGLVTK